MESLLSDRAQLGASQQHGADVSNVPAGWYPSPEDPAQVRYWDGIQWTQHSAPAAAPVPAPAAVVAAAPSAPVYSPPAAFGSPVPPAPMVMSAPTPSSSAKKKWLIGGAIAAGVIVVGSVGAAIGSGGSDRDGAPQASAAPVVAQTVEPEAEPTPTPTPTPTAAPAPAPEPEVVVVVDAVAFRAQAGSHLDDMNKDLDDIIVTVQEDGFWRLLSNSSELAFNLGQLQALEVPSNVAATWPDSLASLEATLDVLSDAVSTQDGPTILAAVDTVRAQVEATRGVANSAQ
jgi:hypothetical protein